MRGQIYLSYKFDVIVNLRIITKNKLKPF